MQEDFMASLDLSSKPDIKDNKHARGTSSGKVVKKKKATK